MKRHGLSVLFAFLLVTPLCAEVRYNFVDLGTLGGKTSVAYSINNSGQIVGIADLDSGAGNAKYRATLFDQTGNKNNTNLGILPGYSYSQGTAINDRGQVVGLTIGSVGADVTLFDSTGQGSNTNLGGLNNSHDNSVNCINNNGKIGGLSDHRATIFDITGNGNNINLGLEGCVISINNHDQAVGFGAYYPGRVNAVLFDVSGNGRNINLGAAWNVIGWESVAYAINSNGQTVGYVTKGTSGRRPVLFDISGGQNNIVLSDSEGYALGNNNLGQIVGCGSNSPGDISAFLFDGTGQGNNIDLNILTDNLNGMHLRYAYGINDNGWIVGQATAPDNTFHAFLLTPVPEPATLLSLSLGLCLIRRFRR
jgi:probable HAF family extracellular repeat protein